MVGTVIDTADVDPSLVFRSSINTFNDTGVMNYLKNNVSNFYNGVVNSSSMFADKIKNMYGDMTDNSMFMKAKSILSNSNTFIKNDIIQYRDEDTIFTSGMLNRRYIMANPTLNEMYSNNRVDGWMDMWLDTEPHMEPTLRDDYRNVMDGIGVFTDEGMVVTNYSSDDETELTLEEKYIVHDLWDTAMSIMDDGIDPTNEIKGSEL